MDAFLSFHHNKPPCKHMRAAIMNRYLNDYAMCTLQQQRGIPSGASSSASGNSSMALAASARGRRRPAPAQQRQPARMTVKVGKNVAKTSGLFNKGRNAKVLEELVFDESQFVRRQGAPAGDARGQQAPRSALSEKLSELNVIILDDEPLNVPAAAPLDPFRSFIENDDHTTTGVISTTSSSVILREQLHPVQQHSSLQVHNSQRHFSAEVLSFNPF